MRVRVSQFMFKTVLKDKQLMQRFGVYQTDIEPDLKKPGRFKYYLRLNYGIMEVH